MDSQRARGISFGWNSFILWAGATLLPNAQNRFTINQPLLDSSPTSKFQLNSAATTDKIPFPHSISAVDHRFPLSPRLSMASKFGLAGGLPERRVRPIWDAIDSRQFKNALKAVKTLLSKYLNAPYALVTKYNPSFSVPDSESLWFQLLCILMVISCFLVSHFSIALSVFSGFILSFLFQNTYVRLRLRLRKLLNVTHDFLY